jgi:hypothetical protein
MVLHITERHADGRPKNGYPVPVEEAGIQYDESSERDANYCRWSSKFPNFIHSSFSLQQFA